MNKTAIDKFGRMDFTQVKIAILEVTIAELRFYDVIFTHVIAIEAQIFDQTG